jgi:DNA-binding NtrC family response regulator
VSDAPLTHTLLYTDDERGLWVRRCRVEVTSGPSSGRSCKLEHGSVWVGSALDNDLTIEGDKTVSRRHIEIQLRDDGILVKDLGSTNGTFFQNARIREIYVQPGAELKVGQTMVRLVSEDQRITVRPSADSQFEGLLGRSGRMREIFDLLGRVGPTRATVLLEGETGTGKELIAEAIHMRSPRREGPFVVFDAGAVAANLLESELFGHVKGAFTGATNTRRGAFERAHTGTIFLDEIGEMSLDLQPKLLRALEAQEVRRVGDDVTHKIDVRVVAATNKDLKAEVAGGRFRADLYFRLAVVRIQVPSLRERHEDIPLLVDHFLGASPKRPNPDILAMLERYNWPGNVRELRNLVERVKAFGWNEALDATGLAQGPTSGPGGDIGAGAGALGGPNSNVPFKDAKSKVVEAFERDYLVDLMKRTKGNISAAAREAGIDRNHLTKLLQKYGIGTKRF